MHIKHFKNAYFVNKKGCSAMIRTDMACEEYQRTFGGGIEGAVSRSERAENACFEIHRTQILTKQASQKLSKPVGSYVTIKTCDLPFDAHSDAFAQRVEVIAGEILSLCKERGSVLVAGLGNEKITPDAIGALCARGIFATRHIKQFAGEIYSAQLTEVSALHTGVIGQTGVEAADIVKAVCAQVRPDIVIAVDALACCDAHSLGCTIQLTDTGISPGSGVANSRKELSRATLGVPCIAIGIPTVIDCEAGGQTMMVTPRNIDSLVQNGARYISCAINRAFQPFLTLDELMSLV